MVMILLFRIHRAFDNEFTKRIGIGIYFSSEVSRSFPPILRAVPIPIKILKKDLDPGFSDPFVRSSNSLHLSTRMCPIQSGINTRTFHSIQFWIDIRIDLWMCNIVNANSLSWMGIHRVGENNLIQFTFTNWLPSFQIKSWMGMRVCANGIRIGHNSALKGCGC